MRTSTKWFFGSVLYLHAMLSIADVALRNPRVIVQNSRQLILGIEYDLDQTQGDGICMGALPTDLDGNIITNFTYVPYLLTPGERGATHSGYAYIDIRLNEMAGAFTGGLAVFMYSCNDPTTRLYEETYIYTKTWAFINDDIDTLTFRQLSADAGNLRFDVRCEIFEASSPASLIPLLLYEGSYVSTNGIPSASLSVSGAPQFVEATAVNNFPGNEMSDAVLLILFDTRGAQAFAVVPRVKYWSDSLADSDNDGISDESEARLGTDPNVVDTDDDGLEDGWELEGYRWNGLQYPDSNLPLLGADPLRRDVFVEVDYMSTGNHHHQLPPVVINKAKGLYAGLDIVNADGTRGVDLHILNDHALDFDESLGGVCGMRDRFSAYFYPRKHRIYHWLISGHGEGGQADIISNHLVVGSGNGTPVGVGGMSARDQFLTYAVLVHELGHNFGCLHGGRDGGQPSNCKPNYPSLMNYAYDFSFGCSPLTFSGTRIQFSRGFAPDLNEMMLNETGPGLSALSFVSGYDFDFLGCNALGVATNPTTANINIDWNQDRSYSLTSVSVDFAPPSCSPAGVGDGLQSDLRDSDDHATIEQYLGESIRNPNYDTCSDAGATGNRFVPAFNKPVDETTKRSICSVPAFTGVFDHSWLRKNPVHAFRPGDTIDHPLMRELLGPVLNGNNEIIAAFGAEFPPDTLVDPPAADPDPPFPALPPGVTLDPPPACIPLLDPNEIPFPKVLHFDAWASGTVLSNLYRDLCGVEFEATTDVQATVLLPIAITNAAHSLPNVLANVEPNPIPNINHPMTIWFTEPKTHVGFYMGNGDDLGTVYAELRAYDQEGNLLCQHGEAVPIRVEQFLGLHDPAGRIARVAIDYGSTTQFETIDDLHFAPGGRPPPAVPVSPVWMDSITLPGAFEFRVETTPGYRYLIECAAVPFMGDGAAWSSQLFSDSMNGQNGLLELEGTGGTESLFIHLGDDGSNGSAGGVFRAIGR